MKILKRCTDCGLEKPLDQFYEQKRDSGTLRHVARCKDCYASRSAARFQNLSPEKREEYYESLRNRKLFENFGITREQYDELWQAQGGLCKICGKPETAKEERRQKGRVRLLAVDHDHLTGEVRGLLCMLCNTRMGYFEKHGLIGALLSYLKIEELV